MAEFVVRKDSAKSSIYFDATKSIQALNVSDSDKVKALANYKALDLGKPCFLQKECGALIGMGIPTENGDLWVYQREVVAPEFFLDKVKISSAQPLDLDCSTRSKAKVDGGITLRQILRAFELKHPFL